MSHVDRRTFMISTGAFVGGTLLNATDAFGPSGQGPAASGGRIDIHHHFAPPAWIAEVKGRPLLQPATAGWTLEQSLEDLDQAGTAAAVVSVTNPGLWFGDDAATARVARACNDYGAQLVQRYPTRFGLFAAMPLPDVDATLREIAHAYDTLRVDGIGLFTSYGDRWLGHESFRPVMEELNRRRAVVHVHPTAANCCRNLAYGVGPNAIEYGTDTTRAMIGVTFSGDTVRYPNIRFIWSHAGGSAPFLAGRIEGQSANVRDRLPNGFMAEAKKCFYDTAGATNRGALVSLLELVSSSRILFGTDFPPGGSNAAVSAALASVGLFDSAALQAVERGNALTLLPRLRG